MKADLKNHRWNSSPGAARCCSWACTSLFWIFALLTVGLSLPEHSSAKIVYKTVEAEGYGGNLDEAIDEALAHAISQVSGQTFDAKNSAKMRFKTITEDGKTSKVASEELEASVKERTKGVVRSYEILEKAQEDSDTLFVKIRAVVADYQTGKGASRVRIAVMPLRISGLPASSSTTDLPSGVARRFSVDGAAGDPRRLEGLVNQGLVSALVQTRKFTILDRDYVAETLGEQAFIDSDDVPIVEAAKLGQKLGADFILVGSLERMTTRLNERKMRTTDQVIRTRSGNVELSYRIIDVANGMVKSSDLYRRRFQGGELGEAGGADAKMASVTGQEVGAKILLGIYPLLIEAVDGNEVTIGQGGGMIQVGDRFEIMERGEKLKDSYTKESIGRRERKIGTLEIIRVGPKASTGKVQNSEVDLAAGFSRGRYALNPLPQKRRSAAPSVSQVKKKIEKKREARDKEYEDEW